MARGRIAAGLLLVALVVGLVGLHPGATRPARAAAGQSVYMPLGAYTPTPPPPTVFGTEFISHLTVPTAHLAREAGMHWIRVSGFRWSAVEPYPGARHWIEVAEFEQRLKAISANGMRPVVVILSTPDWAQRDPGVPCGPIAPHALDDFAAFMADMVVRYSQPPYNVEHWEIWNEPDVAWADIQPPDPRVPFGCWGDRDDYFYGGGYYGEMLKVVTPAIRQVDPKAKVVVGGLLLDCDPTIDPACNAGRFFEGILAAGAGNAFDIVGYHSYPFWTPRDVDWDFYHGKWVHRGGVLVGKAHFLRERLAAHGLDKRLLMNEGGLLCHPSRAPCPEPELRAAQANYAIRLYVRSWAQDLEGAIWFTFNGPGWRDGGLLTPQQEPLPAYDAIRFLSTKLRSARFVNSKQIGDVEEYIFQADRVVYRIYWRNIEGTSVIPIPPFSTLYDPTGRQIPATGSYTLGFEPLIVESFR